MPPLVLGRNPASPNAVFAAIQGMTEEQIDALAALIGGGYQPVSEKDVPGGYAGLDGDGKLDPAQIPSIAITDYLGAVDDEAAMLALTGEQGDWCIRTDEGKVYIITGPDPSDIGSWTALAYPEIPVENIPSADEKAAMTEANTPSASNPFATAADLDGKADKITGGTNGNLVARDAGGNIIDSGKRLALNPLLAGSGEAVDGADVRLIPSSYIGFTQFNSGAGSFMGFALNSALVDAGKAWTVGALVRPDEFTVSTYYGCSIFSCFATPTTGTTSTPTIGFNPFGKLGVKDGVTGVYTAFPAAEVCAAGTWYAVGAAYDPAANTITGYINGVSQGSLSVGASCAAPVSLLTNHGSAGHSHGQLARFAAINATLSASGDILQLAYGLVGEKYLHAYGAGGTFSAGVLHRGRMFRITDNSGGLDMANCGAANNNVGTLFITPLGTATGITPTSWGTGSVESVGVLCSLSRFTPKGTMVDDSGRCMDATVRYQDASDFVAAGAAAVSRTIAVTVSGATVAAGTVASIGTVSGATYADTAALAALRQWDTVSACWRQARPSNAGAVIPAVTANGTLLLETSAHTSSATVASGTKVNITHTL